MRVIIYADVAPAPFIAPGFTPEQAAAESGMIAFLRGKLAVKSTEIAVVECNGIGYEVRAPLTTLEHLPPIGDEVFLLTEFVVRAESHTLYGFSDERSRLIFRRLLKVSGVGAKTALILMSALSPDELLSALAKSDTTRLSSVPGIGKKTAERMVVDFRGSLLLEMIREGYVSGAGAVIPSWLPSSQNHDVEQALAGLGYKKAEITRAISSLPPDTDEDPAVRLRLALQFLSGKK